MSTPTTPDPGLERFDNHWLRGALSALLDCDRPWRDEPLWQQIGECVDALARRDAHAKPFAEDYRGAYALEAIALLHSHPRDVIKAESPWGAVVSRGQHAGHSQIGRELSGGLCARDASRHRTDMHDVPRVIAFDLASHDRPDRPLRLP